MIFFAKDFGHVLKTFLAIFQKFSLGKILKDFRIFCGENLKSFSTGIETELKQIKNRMKTEIKTRLKKNWNKILARGKRKINFIILKKKNGTKGEVKSIAVDLKKRKKRGLTSFQSFLGGCFVAI